MFGQLFMTFNGTSPVVICGARWGDDVECDINAPIAIEKPVADALKRSVRSSMHANASRTHYRCEIAGCAINGEGVALILCRILNEEAVWDVTAVDGVRCSL